MSTVIAMTTAVERRRDPLAVRRILEALPDWFGDPDAIDNYVEAAAHPDFESYAVTADGATIAIALVHRHFPESAELHLIAVDPGSRGHGIGRSLVDRVATVLSSDGCRYLSVHTVAESFANEAYAQTRAFYLGTGFIPLEEHENLDWPGPSVIMVRALSARKAHMDVR